MSQKLVEAAELETKGLKEEAAALRAEALAGKENIAIQSKAIGLGIKETITTGTKTAAHKLLTVVLGEEAALTKLVGRSFLASLGIFAGGIAIIYGLYKVFKKLAEIHHDNSIEGYTERLKASSEAAKQAQDNYTKLKDSIDDLQNSRSSLDSMKEGTRE